MRVVIIGAVAAGTSKRPDLLYWNQTKMICWGQSSKFQNMRL